MRNRSPSGAAGKRPNLDPALLAAIVESSDDAIFSTALDGVITSWNRGAEQLLGYTAEEATGAPISLLVPADHADEVPSILARVRRGERVTHFESECTHKTGTRLPVLLTVSPLRAPSGRIVAISTVAHDISGRVRAQQEIERLALENAEKAADTSAILEHIPSGVIVVDVQGRLVYINEVGRQISGEVLDAIRRPAEIAGSYTLYEADTGRRLAAAETPVARALRGESVERNTYLFQLHEESEPRWIEASAVPRTEAPGQVVGAIAVVSDVTREHTLRQELLAANAALQASEERYRALFERAPIGIELADRNGRLIDTNATLQEMVGYSRDELRGAHFRDVTHPDDVAAELALDREMDAGVRDRYQLVKRFIRKDGEVVWGRLTSSDVGRIADGTFQFAIGMVEDISERKAAQEALRASEQRYRQLIELSPDMIALIDLDLTVLMVNPRAAELCGYESPEAMKGMRALDLLVPEGEGRVIPLEALLRAGTVREILSRLRRRDGTTFPVEVSVAVISGQDGQPAGIMAMGRDITERLALERELEHRALYDALTGLPNRALVQGRLDHDLQTARHDRSSLALLLLDLSRFKDINDTFGHDFGDALLRAIGPRLQPSLRPADTLGHLGGDEFAIVLPETDRSGATAVARRIANLLAQPFAVEGYALDVMASVGIAFFPEHGEDVITLLRRAEVAMYAAKGSHTDTMIYTAEQDPHSPARLELLRDLRRAIVHGELSLHYQPKVDMRTGRVRGVEALVRWPHPTRGMIPPGDFIPLAEATGLVKEITSVVLTAARRQYETWREADLDLPISFNLSTQDLQGKELIKVMTHIFSNGHFKPGALQVEITERGLIEDGDRAQMVLAYLHGLGVHIAIDDFGTGYSQLGYLKQLPADEIKIDRSFIGDMVHNVHDQAIVKSVIDLGHNLGMQVTAEGVEDGHTWDMLAGMGCDVVQGYYVSRPLPAPALMEWLRGWQGTAAKAS